MGFSFASQPPLFMEWNPMGGCHIKLWFYYEFSWHPRPGGTKPIIPQYKPGRFVFQLIDEKMADFCRVCGICLRSWHLRDIAI
jgi:hypothetical protein